MTPTRTSADHAVGSQAPDHNNDDIDEHGPSHAHGHGHVTAGGDDKQPHGHDHPGGLRGLLRSFVAPHSHDAAESVDQALTASAEGIRALKLSLAALLLTAALQVVVVVISGSVALLGDTIHNFADALTAVPLGVAFWLSRRPPTRRYTYGYGRAEDLAGIFIVVMIALSSALGWTRASGRG